MAIKYIPSADNNGVVPVRTRSHQAPPFSHAPLINKPNQPMPTLQPEPQNYTTGPETGYIQDLAHQLAQKATVQLVPVQQPAHKILSPLRAWREGWRSRPVNEQPRVPVLNLKAPVKLQSVPGYVVTQTQTVTNGKYNNGLATMYTNLRAPTLSEAAGGKCNGN